MYLKRIQEIDAMLNRLSGIERVDGYGPYDDMNAIPTVFKEDPVYVKPPPGLTLRSARFDNNVGNEERGKSDNHINNKSQII